MHFLVVFYAFFETKKTKSCTHQVFMPQVDGIKLQEARRLKGFSQASLAEKTGLSQSKISRAEKTGAISESDLHILISSLDAYHLLFESCESCATNLDIGFRHLFPEHPASRKSTASSIQDLMIEILHEIGPLRARIDSLKPESDLYKADLLTWRTKINQLHALATLLQRLF